MDNEVFQLVFPGMEIDEEATFNRLEKELKAAALYKRIGFIRREPVTTPSYTASENTGLREVSKQTEKIAVYNVDGEERAKHTYDRVTYAISKLRHIQIEIITKRYMAYPEPQDFNVWKELNMSERTYYRWLREAKSELAYALRLEVIVDN